MKPGFAALCAAALAAAALAALPADARSTSIQAKRCHEEWKAMKANDATGDKKYADFRKECLARQAAAQPTTGAAPGTTTAAAPAAPAPAPAPAPAAPAAPAPPASQPPAATHPSPGAHGAADAPASAEPVFPTAIAPQYANEKPGVARRKTCLAQFRANKASGANGGLPWLKTGGGFYTECNKRLGG